MIFKSKRSNNRRKKEKLTVGSKLLVSPLLSEERTRFSLGENYNGDVLWDPFHSPSLMVYGETAPERTAFLKNIAHQALIANWNFSIVSKNSSSAIDWKRFPLFNPSVSSSSILRGLLEARELVIERMSLINESGVSTYLGLGNTVTPVIVIIDGLDETLSRKEPVGDYLHIQRDTALLAHTIVLYLAKFGKTAGVFIAASTGSTKWTSGELMNEFHSEVRLRGYVSDSSPNYGRDVIVSESKEAIAIFGGDPIEFRPYGMD